jgi:hypothetical protein
MKHTDPDVLFVEISPLLLDLVHDRFVEVVLKYLVDRPAHLTIETIGNGVHLRAVLSSSKHTVFRIQRIKRVRLEGGYVIPFNVPQLFVNAHFMPRHYSYVRVRSRHNRVT